jgi:hypothetical protein
MNDTLSLLLATTVLALGGLGLYMYKSSDMKEDVYNEEEIFSDDESVSDDDSLSDEEEEVYQPKPRARSNEKTKTRRNKNATGSKRRY